MSRNKKLFIRISIALFSFVIVSVAFALQPLKDFSYYAKNWVLSDYRFYVYFIPYMAIYLTVGIDVLFKAFRNVFTGKLFDENFLMTVATIGAIALCDLPEAVAVMLFYQIGELFQKYAVGKSRKSISALMDICPETACVVRDGVEQTVFPEEVCVGEMLIVRAGEKIAVDCVVLDGNGSLDCSSLTGESVPREVAEGDTVLSGSINLSGVLKVKATKEYNDSTVAKILNLVENATSKKAKTEKFITKFARYYTPIVVFSAIALGVIPPLFNGNWSEWVERALTFLVVSCPCALVISVPLAFFGGIGGASKQGILIKGGNCLEVLSKCGVVAFDKTGTLTKGRFEVVEVFPESNREEILRLASILESGSLHPIAQSIVRACSTANNAGYTLKEVAGRGVEAVSESDRVIVGSYRFLKENNVELNIEENSGSAVYLAKNGVFMGYIRVEDREKDNAREVVSQLKKIGCKTVMLTGDGKSVAKTVGEKLEVDEWRAEMLPQDKVKEVEKLIEQKGSDKTVCFVGDGINDAPVLAVADVGISMGGIGSDVAIEASDIVLMTDDLSCLPKAIKISTKTVRTVKQNIVFALGVKIAVLVLSAFGVTGMWLAVFADVGVAVLAILNSMRTLRVKK